MLSTIVVEMEREADYGHRKEGPEEPDVEGYSISIGYFEVIPPFWKSGKIKPRKLKETTIRGNRQRMYSMTLAWSLRAISDLCAKQEVNDWFRQVGWCKETSKGDFFFIVDVPEDFFENLAKEEDSLNE